MHNATWQNYDDTVGASSVFLDGHADDASTVFQRLHVRDDIHQQSSWHLEFCTVPLYPIFENSECTHRLSSSLCVGARSLIIQNCCSLLHLPPEWHSTDSYSNRLEGDIYSFGILMFELFHYTSMPMHMRRAHGLTVLQAYEAMWSGGFRPAISKDCPKTISKLILQCLSPDPCHRPTLENILLTLEQFMQRPFRHRAKRLKALVKRSFSALNVIRVR